MEEIDEPKRAGPVIALTVAPTAALPGTGLSATERKELRTLEARIAAGIRSFLDVGGSLLAIRDARLYRETHSSFESYAREKWDLERARAYQFMAAAEVMQALPAGDSKMVTNEAQARALAPILRERGVSGVASILAGVRERGVPITAPLIRRVATDLMHPNQPAEPTFSDRLVRDMGRLTSEYRQWLATGPSRKEKATVKAATEQLIASLT